MSASSTPASGLVRMNPPVFWFAATVILLFGLTVIAMPEQAGAWLLEAQTGRPTRSAGTTCSR